MKVLGLKIVCVLSALAFLPALAQGQQGSPTDSAKAPQSPTGAASAQAGQNTGNAGTQVKTKAAQEEREIKKKEQSQRSFGVYPQFSVTNRQNAAPLTPREKFHLFYKTAFDPFELALAGLQAGLDQDENAFPGYGEGLKGYGKRYAAEFGDEVSVGFWSDFFWPALLKEDPRYFRLGKGSFKHRFSYALTQEFVVHKDGGGRTFGYSNVLGALSGGALSNAYHPEGDQGLELTLRGAGIALTYGCLGGIVDEFWPDIHDRMLRRHKKTDMEGPAALGVKSP